MLSKVRSNKKVHERFKEYESMLVIECRYLQNESQKLLKVSIDFKSVLKKFF